MEPCKQEEEIGKLKKTSSDFDKHVDRSWQFKLAVFSIAGGLLWAIIQQGMSTSALMARIDLRINYCEKILDKICSITVKP